MKKFKDCVLGVGAGIIISDNPPSAATITEAESCLGVVFGPELRDYLSEVGFAIGARELYGITENQGMSSDLVRYTSILHASIPALRKYVVLEELSDDRYAVCNEDDNVFVVVVDREITFQDTGLKVLNYVISRMSIA